MGIWSVLECSFTREMAVETTANLNFSLAFASFHDRGPRYTSTVTSSISINRFTIYDRAIFDLRSRPQLQKLQKEVWVRLPLALLREREQSTEQPISFHSIHYINRARSLDNRDNEGYAHYAKLDFSRFHLRLLQFDRLNRDGKVEKSLKGGPRLSCAITLILRLG